MLAYAFAVNYDGVVFVDPVNAQPIEIGVTLGQKRHFKLQIADVFQRADFSDVLTYGTERNPVVIQIDLVDHDAEIFNIHG